MPYYPPAGGGGGVAISAGTNSTATGTVLFNNSNGVTFGMDTNGTVTASVQTNYLTTAMASNQGSNFVAATAAFNGTNASGTIAGNAVSVSVAAQSVQPVVASAANGSFNFSTLKFVDTNGVSFATSTDGVRATVATNYQSTGAYLTTAMASNRGSDFVQATAAFAGTNASGTIASNGVSISVAAPGGGGSINFSAGATSGNLASVTFANSNGVSFGLNAGTITATVATNYQSAGAYLTTARASTDAIGLNSALTANGVSVTANSSGLSLNFPAFLTTAMASNRGSDFVQATAAFAGTNASGTVASNGISISVAAPGAGGGFAAQGSGAYTQNTGTIQFANSNGITFGLSTNQMTASHNGITTARASNDGVGLNTALTAGPLAWTVNSSGLSLNAASVAGTTTGFTGANISMSMTHNTAGLAVSASVAAPGGGAGVTASYLNIGAPSLQGTVTISAYVQSTSHMMPFVVPYALSVGSVRMIVAGSVAASSTQGLVNGSTLSAGATTSHNFVFYTRGAGASSQSLQYVTSTQIVDRNSVNVQNAAGANSTQLSYSNRWSIGNTSFTKDYSSSAASYNFHTSNLTDLTGTKQIDYPCGISLSQGQWFLGYGRSTNSATQNAAVSVATRMHVSYNSQIAMSQATLGAVGLLGGATNSSVMLATQGLGSYSTSGAAGTTASVELTRVSSGASNNIMYFQLVRIT